MPAETRTLARVRLTARAPRIAVLAATGLLSVAGARAALVPAAAGPARTPLAPVIPSAVAPFAEAFARDYLSWDRDDPGDREQRLAPYLADGLDPDAGLVPAPGRGQRVTWSSAASPRGAPRGAWAVTVLAGLDDGTRVALVIPVRVTRVGIAVDDYPALTALAARATEARAASWTTPVEDTELERVVERALRNFLAGRASDLQADLAPGARVVTPEQTSRLVAIDELGWQQPGRVVAALVVAELSDRTRLRMRLHLTVRRDGRWFVAALDPSTPSTQGDPR